MLNNYSIEPLWVMRTNYETGGAVRPHAHEHYYHMVYVFNGEFDFVINGRNYHLYEDMLTLARPHEKQSWRNTHNETGSTYDVKFSVLDANLKKVLEKLPAVMTGSTFFRLLLEKIDREKEQMNSNYQEYIGMYLYVLLYGLVRGEIIGLSQETIDMKSLGPVEAAKKYISENYNTDLSLDVIARAISFEKSYLSAAFRNSEGITLWDYLYKYRVFKACELIAYSDIQFSEVSQLTGFKHVEHFNRVFKKNIGIPPGEYRTATPKTYPLSNKVVEKFNSEVLPVRSGRIYEVESDTGFFKKKS